MLKLEKSCRKLEEALMKADREYKDSNLKTEQSRLGWEAAMYQCCKVGHYRGGAGRRDGTKGSGCMKGVAL